MHVRSCYYFDDYGTARAALEHDCGTAGAVLLSWILSGPGILQFSPGEATTLYENNVLTLFVRVSACVPVSMKRPDPPLSYTIYFAEPPPPPTPCGR